MAKESDPKMHTAEHLLNQTMVRMFNCGRCFSAHIEKKKSKCDYHFNRALRDDEITKIDEEINGIIQSDLLVGEEFVSLDEAGKNFSLKKLPAGQSRIRIIKIGDYDAVPCIGPHVKSTGEIGKFKIISSDYNEGVLRIRYKLAA